MNYAKECMLCEGESQVMREDHKTIIECLKCGLTVISESRESAVGVFNADVYHQADCQQCDDKRSTINTLKSDILSLLKKIDALKAELLLGK